MVKTTMLKHRHRALKNVGSARLCVSSHPRNILITNIIAIAILPEGDLIAWAFAKTVGTRVPDSLNVRVSRNFAWAACCHCWRDARGERQSQSDEQP